MANIGIPALKDKVAEIIQPRIPPDYIWPEEHEDLLIDLIDTLTAYSEAYEPVRDMQTQAEAVDGTPSPSDDEAIHEFTVEYSEVPIPNLVNKCDWMLYIKNISIADNTVTVTIGIGGSGSSDELFYDIHITH